MTSISIDIKDGLSSSVAIKGPCKVATTANVTLLGEQTIDGVAVVTDDRVLVKNQTTASDNGIYVVDTGNWRRSKDFNKTKDVKTGTLVNVTSGTGAGVWELTTADPISVGSTNLVFAQSILTSLDVIDEDDMASNSATKVPTQQSVKAYADTKLKKDMTDLTTGVVSIDMANSTQTNEGPFYTQILTTDHNVNKTGLGGLFGGVLRLVTYVGGLTMRGYRIAFQSTLLHDQKAQHAENQFVAGTFQAIGSASGAFNGSGLTAATAKGGLFAGNSYVGAQSGYTYLYNGTATEFNTAFLTGSSVYYKSGIQVVGLDEVQGSEIDAAISISGSGGLPGKKGYRHGILFGSQNAGNPVDAVNGVLIGDYYNPTAAIPLVANVGIDLRNYDWVSGIILTKAFKVGVNGTVEIGDPAVATSPALDFHSSGAGNDYDARFFPTGGSAVDGSGTLTFVGARLNIDAPIRLQGGSALVLAGSGNPEGSATAPVGSVYTDTANRGVYYKSTGTGNTGWTWVDIGSTPISKSADFTLAAGERYIGNLKAGSTCTVTLPAPSTCPGRVVDITNYQAFTVVSASANIIAQTGSGPTSAILPATTGKWATLVADPGLSAWRIMRSN